MSWKETYEQWLKQPNLAPTLKAELDAMKDDKEIEDAFYVHYHLGLPECVD